MEEPTSIEDRRIEAFLEPLRTLTPAGPAPAASSRAKRLRTALVGGVAVVALAIGGVAFARGAFTSHATPDRSPVSARRRLACSPLVGMDAQRAATDLRGRGEVVSWRLTRYVNPAQNGGVVGFASDVASPPAGTVVEDVASDAQGLVVFIRRTDDANAPPLVTSRC